MDKGKYFCFSLFNITPAYRINLPQLKAAYLKLQKTHHPDVIASSSATSSADINLCYSTLTNPLQRAKYIMKQENISVNVMDKIDLNKIYSKMVQIEDMTPLQKQNEINDNNKEITAIVQRY